MARLGAFAVAGRRAVFRPRAGHSSSAAYAIAGSLADWALKLLGLTNLGRSTRLQRARTSTIGVKRGADRMIELEAVRKVYPDGHVALQALSLVVERGTTLALLGPSGCGKTTTLKLINRLVDPTGGRVCIDGRDSAELDPIALRRDMGFVVQDAGLFPHLTALGNVEVVPRLLGWSAARRLARARELFALTGLDFAALAGRYPAQLSGGQRQRVGLARALAVDPPIVLMDEPFGALDPITRRRLHDEFLVLKARLRKTVVLVTHDVEEAFRLADRVALLNDGTVAQLGTPAEIRAAPASTFVASFIGHGAAVAS
jgi:osmoprotectant transport system ATP-binding protein